MRVKLDEDELALIIDSVRFQRHFAEDETGKKDKSLKEFIKFCKKLEKKLEGALEDGTDHSKAGRADVQSMEGIEDGTNL